MSAVEVVGMPRGHGPTGAPEGGSLSSMGGRTPPATPKKVGGKILSVKILMLDDTYTLFQIQVRTPPTAAFHGRQDLSSTPSPTSTPTPKIFIDFFFVPKQLFFVSFGCHGNHFEGKDSVVEAFEGI